MKIIVGLGNPGSQYEATRHNVGFMTLDLLAENLNIDFRKQAHFSTVGEGRVGGEKVLLMKPMTFMNLSGRAVRDAVDFYKVDLTDLLIIYDDMDLSPGRIRIRPGGSDGGHNGINSIISHLSGRQVARIKIGIGRPERETTVKYVLMPFPDQDWDLVKPSIEKAAQAAEVWLKEGIEPAMNRYNGISSQ
ncbi:aminoacyl-tRNA hydrolase [Dehalobacterium formicoaceticum]|uniref:Peptidyl-tRNA hydrolase n=1 Tax=Dehalobacterium formicoaceticum TaxID=51515 RepID=A0ABT1Y393_9FIRM|nr:aminoacyl-tRNA hydrolase [Dehalobacterium formicoaceticum]MCR6545343.1 aminoacyl-tRNA hydrolase [Dehalobacterium formicoaceticum]